MNQDQVTGTVRGALIALGPSIIALGVPNGAWQIALSLIPTLAGFVWSYMAHTNAATVTAAAAVPGAKVQIDPLAASDLVAMANDRSIPNVVPAPIATVSPDARRF